MTVTLLPVSATHELLRRLTFGRERAANERAQRHAAFVDETIVARWRFARF